MGCVPAGMMALPPPRLVASEAAAFAHIRRFSLYKLDKKRIEKERNEKVANFQEWQFMQSEKLVMRQHRLSNAES